MKTKFDRKLLLKPKKSNLPRLFQKKTWSWVVRLQIYDTIPTVPNLLWYSYLHYTSCNEFKNKKTAYDYIDNFYKKNKIDSEAIIPGRFNKESATTKKFESAFENKEFNNNFVKFLNAHRTSETLIRVFIKNNIDLLNESNTSISNVNISTATVIKEKDNAPIKTEENLEEVKTEIKIREGVDLKTYKIVWEMRDKNPTNDLNLFKNKLEFETAFRLWMKDTFGVNTMKKETILDNWNFSYKKEIIELKKERKPLGQLRKQLGQIIANDDIFEARYVIEAKKILADFP